MWVHWPSLQPIRFKAYFKRYTRPFVKSAKVACKESTQNIISNNIHDVLHMILTWFSVVNGALGTINSIGKDCIHVTFDHSTVPYF